jgi:mannose-6-phosphate isomerase-like protein (cupin superfamily)
MRLTMVLLAFVFALSPADAYAQRRTKPAPRATLAITVSAADGTPIPDALVTVEGPAERTLRTEGGRAVLEGVPAGEYRLRFEREGFVPLEKELTARAGKPTEVKVTLSELPAPPPPPVEVPAPKPPASSTAKALAADLAALTEKEWIGRAPLKTTLLACSEGTNSTLIQLNRPLADHAHPDADEVFYVVGGEGVARVENGQQKLHAGVFLFIPRGRSHELTPSGRNPLIVMSVRAGEPCPAPADAKAARDGK